MARRPPPPSPPSRKGAKQPHTRPRMGMRIRRGLYLIAELIEADMPMFGGMMRSEAQRRGKLDSYDAALRFIRLMRERVGNRRFTGRKARTKDLGR